MGVEHSTRAHKISSDTTPPIPVLYFYVSYYHYYYYDNCIKFVFVEDDYTTGFQHMKKKPNESNDYCSMSLLMALALRS